MAQMFDCLVMQKTTIERCTISKFVFSAMDIYILKTAKTTFLSAQIYIDAQNRKKLTYSKTSFSKNHTLLCQNRANIERHFKHKEIARSWTYCGGL